MQLVHRVLVPSSSHDGGTDSHDGGTDRIILAYEALEECASGFGQPSTDKDPVVGQQVAWRLARRAGIKFLDEAVAPMLTSLTESAISGVLHRAIAAATSTVDTDGCGDSILHTQSARVHVDEGVRVDVGTIRKSIKAEPFLFGQACVGVSGADEIIFRVSASEHYTLEPMASTAASMPPAELPHSDEVVEQDECEDVDSDEEELELLSSVENLSAANLSADKSYGTMLDGDKVILMDRINAMGEEDFNSVRTTFAPSCRLPVYTHGNADSYSVLSLSTV